jgi:hypothetical protein
MAHKQKPTAHVIVDDREQPTLALRPGMKFEVHATSIVDAELKPSTKIAARLCGGSGTCLALVELNPNEVKQ